MTWDGVVTKYHRRHSKGIGITESVESYIQTTDDYIEDAGEHILRMSTRHRASRRDRGQANPKQRAGARGRSSSLPGTN
ncbi:hypothetical protein PAEPH01_1139 [Pancytospora epiphaga]|nr:hypothetical protein PAEPH01_1139 [Pancytospora epiphaga]